MIFVLILRKFSDFGDDGRPKASRDDQRRPEQSRPRNTAKATTRGYQRRADQRRPRRAETTTGVHNQRETTRGDQRRPETSTGYQNDQRKAKATRDERDKQRQAKTLVEECDTHTHTLWQESSTRLWPKPLGQLVRAWQSSQEQPGPDKGSQEQTRAARKKH